MSMKLALLPILLVNLQAAEIETKIISAEEYERKQKLESDNLTLNESLYKACFRKSLEKINDLLNRGASVHYRDKYGTTPLHIASQYSSPEVVRLLLKYGADVNAQDKFKYTPLIEAIREGKLANVIALVENKADVGTKFYDTSPVLMAILSNRQEIANYLLKSGSPEVEDVAFYIFKNQKDRIAKMISGKQSLKSRLGGSAIDYAVRLDREEIVRLLLENGAEVTGQPQLGDVVGDPKSQVMYACEKGSFKSLRVMQNFKPDYNVQDNFGNCLEHAVNGEHQEVVYFLLARGVNPNQQFYHYSYTKNNGSISLNFVALPLEKAEALKGNKKDFYITKNQNALGLAARKGNVCILKMLIEKGAKCMKTGDSDKTPLYYAATGNHLEATMYLLDHCPDYSETDIYGENLLKISIKNKWDSIIKRIESSKVQYQNIGNEKSSGHR